MYPMGCVPHKFYGLPKIHKPDTPLRPIVFSCGSVAYGVARELAKILKPLVVSCKAVWELLLSVEEIALNVYLFLFCT